MAAEFHAHGNSRYVADAEHFEEFLARSRDDAEGRHLPGTVPMSRFWLVEAGRIVGSSRLRHVLTPELEHEGGHIGYDIRPSARRQGLGTSILRLTLERAAARGLSRVKVTCDADNIGSIRVIENNGGVLAGEVPSLQRGTPIRQYWIELGGIKRGGIKRGSIQLGSAAPAPTIRAILFDADGVIQRSSSEAFGVQLERLGVAAEHVDACLREIFEVERAALIGRADFAEVLVPVLEKWGAAGGAARLAAEWGCAIEVDATLLALVAQLRQQGWLCALATNQQHYRATYMTRAFAYDSAFDQCFFSYRLGAAKPDAAYFQAIVAALGCAPQQVLFIDDAEKNVAGARRAGLHAVQLVCSEKGAALAAIREILARFAIAVGGQPEQG